MLTTLAIHIARSCRLGVAGLVTQLAVLAPLPIWPVLLASIAALAGIAALVWPAALAGIAALAWPAALAGIAALGCPAALGGIAALASIAALGRAAALASIAARAGTAVRSVPSATAMAMATEHNGLSILVFWLRSLMPGFLPGWAVFRLGR
jgi:hypothetical protein